MAKGEQEPVAAAVDDARPFDHPIVTSSGVDLAKPPPEEDSAAANQREMAKDMALLTEPLKTPKLRLEATHAGASAAGLLALLNVLSAFYVWNHPVESLIGSDPQVLFAAQFVAAAVAGLMAWMIYTKSWLWACEVVLAWSLIELDPWLTRWLYGHYWRPNFSRSGIRTFELVLFIIGLAMIGVRGAWALRRAAREAADVGASAANPTVS